MSELISGKEALNNWYDNIDTEIQYLGSMTWYDINSPEVTLEDFKGRCNKFRLKPRTITINGIEVPCSKSKHDKDDVVWVINTACENWYDWIYGSGCDSNTLYWETEEEIKQVVAALGSAF